MSVRRSVCRSVTSSLRRLLGASYAEYLALFLSPTDIFSFLDSLPSWALEVLYWHSPLKTGVIFFSCFSVLFLLSIYSAVAVFAYAALSILTVTFSFVVYRRCEYMALK